VKAYSVSSETYAGDYISLTSRYLAVYRENMLTRFLDGWVVGGERLELPTNPLWAEPTELSPHWFEGGL